MTLYAAVWINHFYVEMCFMNKLNLSGTVAIIHVLQMR